MKALLVKRPDAVRWAYLPAALVSALFATMGWGEAGLSAAWPFLLMLFVCFVQCAYPTVLAWVLILVPCLAYATAVAITPGNGTSGEYLLSISCGAVPAAFLLFFRPWSKKQAGGL